MPTSTDISNEFLAWNTSFVESSHFCLILRHLIVQVCQIKGLKPGNSISRFYAIDVYNKSSSGLTFRTAFNNIFMTSIWSSHGA